MTEVPDASPDNASAAHEYTGPHVTLLKLFAGLFAGLGVIVLLISLMLPVSRTGRYGAHRSQCKNSLKQIALALHNYESIYQAFPPACTVDAAGKPLHSWRTLILPYLDQQQLYNTIDLSKPWNDPANAKAYKARVPYYHCPASDCPANHTTYLAIVAPNGCFRLTEPWRLSEIIDGTSETVMVIEVGSEHSVPWMCPRDADERLVMNFGRKLAHIGGVQAVLVDGSVFFLSEYMSADHRRAMISIAGGDHWEK